MTKGHVLTQGNSGLHPPTWGKNCSCLAWCHALSFQSGCTLAPQMVRRRLRNAMRLAGGQDSAAWTRGECKPQGCKSKGKGRNMVMWAATAFPHPDLFWSQHRKLSGNTRALRAQVYLYTYPSSVPARALCPPHKSCCDCDSHNSIVQDYLCLLAAQISQGSPTAFT